jgi:hypothetical protein
MNQRAVTSAIVTLLVAVGVYAVGGRLMGEQDAVTMPTARESTTTEATTTTGYPANSEYVDAGTDELPSTSQTPQASTSAPTSPVKPAGTPSTQTPATQTPSTQTPSTQTPSTQTPTTQTPTTNGQGAGFPTTIPVSIEGAVVTRYVPSNDVQASLLGLDQGDVRSWTLTFTTSGDTKADHQRIRDGLAAAGMRVGSDDLQYFLDSGSGQIVGNWQGFGFTLIASKWTNLTFSLINW